VGVAGELRGVARGYTRGRGVLGTMRLTGGVSRILSFMREERNIAVFKAVLGDPD
jgi:hypothetical protein